MKPKIILFDIIGVIIEYNKKIYLKLSDEFFAKNGIDTNTLGEADKAWTSRLKRLVVEGKLSYEDAIGEYFKIIKRFDLTKKFVQWEDDNYNLWMSLRPNVMEAMTALKKFPLKIVALSNYVKSSDVRKRELDAMGVGKYFDRVCSSHSLGAAKPSKEAFSKAVENVPFSQVIFVGHDDNELLAAKNLGMITIGLGNKNATYTIEDIKDLPFVVEMIMK